ncbi:hypothetical protein [Amphibacillus cookii]|uniref:hypothetical protein n=1 Tax=Amphibacillus cookii TaxID=767787 RepID=UPI0019582B90|nr:hypothetical protein [Amphibacillus cookii]MBM7540942.1 hypothetical protein [Amphibacillus cookii]
MTNEIISRWKELNSLNPELPYPQEEVVNKNWLEVGLFYNKELIDLDLTISDYILGGILQEGQTAEELVAGELYQYEE